MDLLSSGSPFDRDGRHVTGRNSESDSVDARALRVLAADAVEAVAYGHELAALQNAAAFMPDNAKEG